ncbi:hypothetical protein RT97_25870 [Variovorax paradoxus]|uniref:Tandem-95 repeat protein n=1 Tax=Variovorax paradoxus TaxID=34073 RepID=A0A0D0M0W3_VARPD|nr:Ig-like domain-containing protein [Variovorax paradoxus]KIQ23265.1 hypothetical protein RT97_25870 [Variovorax paradoxus]
MALEARYMFDAAAVATGAEVLAAQAAAQQADAAIADAARQADHAPAAAPAPAPAELPRPDHAREDTSYMYTSPDSKGPVNQGYDVKAFEGLGDALQAYAPRGMQDTQGAQIVFIDPGISDVSTLLQGIDPSAEVVFLDSRSDGLSQIASALNGRTDIGAIHILSHGDPGELRLGNAVYDNADLSARAADLAAIGRALGADGDILLYGCDTAQGVVGEQFTHSLSRLTGADVAASVDLTGAQRLGGNWNLEYQVGHIESRVVVDEHAQSLYDSTLDAAVNNGNGAVLAAYGRNIVSIDVTTGKATVLTSVPTSVGGIAVGGTPNALSLNAAAGLVYYLDGASTASRALFAYDYINNTHILIDADITDSGSVVAAGSQGVSGGGAAFFNGAMYLGVENIGSTTTDRIFRLAFSADGRTVTGTSVFVSSVSGGADWGDLAIDTANNALVSVANNDASGRSFVRWDLATGTQLTNAAFTPTAVQLATGTNGAVYALGGTTIQSINPATGALISTVNVTTDGSTAIGGAVADGAGAVPATGTIGDRIFDDNNGDGVFGTGDTGIANVTVQLIDDVNGNGVADAGERVLATDTTNATGNYLFTGVLPGAYVVRVTDTNGVLGGSSPTNGAAFRAVSLATIGGSDLTSDFAYDKVPPVVDLNSGTNTTNIVNNPGFTGGGSGWSSTGSTTFSSDRAQWTSDISSGTLTQAGLTGLQSGPGTNGAAQIVFGFGWNNGVPDSNEPSVFTVSVGGVVYATITTGRSGLNPNIATVVYSNGATGPSSLIAPSTFNNWTYTDITINLPSTVANAGSLVFGFTPGTTLLTTGDDVSIDNVRVFTSADITPGRDWNASFTEDGAPVSISDTDATVVDSDSTNMVSAQIVLTNGQAGDLMRIGGVALTNGATGTLNGLTYTVVVSGGVTTINLTGSATKAVYASTIGAITFESTLQNPPASPVRDITVTVSDGAFTSNVAHSFITVVPVNDAPVLSTGSTISYTENGAGTAVAPSITVADVDNATLASASVAITGNFAAGQDILAFVNVPATMGNISGTYNAATGVMTLSSAGNTATTAQWQAALRAVQYSNSSDNPSTAARTVSYTVNDSALNSNVVTSTVNVTAVNDAPVLSGGSTVTYTENGAATAVNGAIVVSDLDNATLASGTVAITGNFVPGQDVLSFTNVPATMGNITGTYNSATGVMTLSSAGNTATTAQWQAALRAVQYANTSEDPSSVARTVTYTVNDSAANSNTVTSTVNVAPVNDAPVNTLPAGWSTNEDAAVGITGLQVSDVDAGSGTLRVTLSVPTGSLTAASGGGVTVTGSGTGTLVLEGSQASINAYLASAARPNFVPTANFNGSVTLTMTTTDLGNAGGGGAQTDTDTATITVAAVNDAPAGTDRTVTINEDGTYTFSAADFPVTDASDTPANGLQSVIITTLPPASQGVLRLNGVAVTAGQVIPAGSLGQLTFTPAANLNGNGIGAFTFQVVDNGGTANGGQNTDLSPNTFNFNITAVNDAPVINPDTANGLEDTPVSGNVLANDTDVDGDVLTVTQFVVNGNTFTAGQTAAIAGVGTLVINANGSFTFTPAADYNGTPPVVTTYSVSDGSTAVTSTLTITVTAVNDAPVNTLPAGWTTNEDATVGLTGLQITDVDAGSATMRVTLSVPNGSLTAASGAGVTVTGSGTGTLVLEGSQASINAYLASAARPNYVPVGNFNGSVTLTMTTSDLGNTGTGGTLTDTDTATITVNTVNDAPAGADRTVTINEDGTYTFSAADFPITDANDTPANSLQSVVITTLPNPAQGVLRLNGVAVTAGQVIPVGSLGQLTFTPAANVNGAGIGSFTFQVVDNGGTANGGQNTDQSPNTFGFNITAVNDAPVGNADTGTGAEDTVITGNVLTNDTDVDGDALAVTQFVVNGSTFTAGQTATIAGVGTLQVNANGSYTFTPAANYNGAAPVVTYTVSDGTATATSTLALTVTAVNDAPVNTLPAGWTTNEDTTVGITGLQISDVDAGTSTVRVTLSVPSGSLTGASGAGVTVTGSGTGTLVLEGSQASINAYLASAARPNYVPVGNFNGSVTLTMTTSDLGNTGTGGTLTDTDTATITVAAVNDAPAGTDRTVSLNEDGTYTFSAADFPITDANDTPANSLQSVVITTLPPAAQGVLRLNGVAVTAGQVIPVGSLGQLTFTPAANVNGAGIGAFTFQVVDNGGTANGGQNTDQSPNTFSFNVTAVNDAPVANPDTVAATEDTPLSIPVANLLGNDTDVEGDTLTITSVQGAVNGTVSLVGGNVVFTPAPNFNGTASFTYTVSDGNGGTATTTVTVNVAAVNDAPVAANDSASTPINTPLANIPVLGNDTDVDGDPLTITAATVNPALGTVTINANGTLSFTPANNVTGPVQVNYTVSDGKGGTSSAVLTVNVGANTPPQSANTTVNGTEDTPVVLTPANFPFTDTDVGQSLASVRIDTLPVNGTLLLNGVAVTAGQTVTVADITAGRLTFVPGANGNGATYASFNFSVQDSGGAFDATPNTLTFNIAAVNDAPVANPDTVVTAEDTPATGNVLANDTDIDGGPLTVTQFVVGGNTFTAGQTATIAGVGTLVINANGSYTFTPAANYNGPVPVATYTVSDGAATATSTLTFSVTPVDDPFTDANETVTTNEDTPLTGSVLTGTTSVDGPVTVTSFTVAGDGTTYTAGQTANIAGVGTLVINANGSYTFTPAANYNGPVPVVTYSMTDGSSGDTSTLTITVAPVDDPFTDANETVTTNEDTPLTGSVLTGTSSVDGPVTVTNFTVAGDGTTYTAGQTATIANVGTLVINANGSYTFTPAANYNGPVPVVTYSMTDGSSGDTSTLTITVAPVDDPFTDANETVTTNEDTPLTGSVLTGTTSVDGPVTVTGFTVAGDATTYTAGQTATIAGVGTLVINANGSYTFTPAANYNGPVPVVTYSMTDGSSGDTSTLTITVAPVDDAFTDANETVSTNEDTPLTGSVLTGTTSVDGPVTVTSFTVAGDATTYTAGQTATIAGVGTLVINTDGSYTFTPAANYNGPVPVVTYSMTDGSSGDTSTLTITVAPVDDPFTDANETVTTNEDTPLTGSVLIGTTSVDGPVTVTGFTVAGDGTTYTAGQTATIANVGTLVINANGSYTFTPAANYNGPVPVVTYSMTDGSSGDTSTLTITVAPVDDAFTDANETVTTNEDTPLTGSVLTGTTSVDGPVTVTSFTVAGDPATYTAGQTANIAGVGTLVINANGSYTFTPSANYNGPVPVVTYSLTDGSSGDTSTLTITVAPVDDPFTDADETATTNEDTPLTGSVLTGTTSVDGPVTVTGFTVAGDATTYTAGQTATIAGVGTLVINANGSYTFTPAANYNGPVPVATYSLTDGSSGDVSTLTITVTPVDDPFTDANEAVTTNEDTPLTGSVLTGTTSVDGPVTVTNFTVAGDDTIYTAGQTATIAGVGTLVINANGSYTFTPAANYNGPVPVVTYSMTDGSSGDTSTLTITVAPVDDPFTDANETVTTNEDTPLTGSVLTGTTSVDGPVTVTGFTVAGDGTTYTAGQTATIANVGTLVINANGSYTFTPAANYNGPVPVVTYSLTDGSSGDTSTLTISVTAANDAPVGNPDTVTVTEDVPATGNVLANDTDVDGDALTVTSFSVAGDGTFTAGQTATIAGVGTLVINANGSYTFTPAANYNGPVPVITYTVSDGTATATSTLTFTVSAVNDAPVNTLPTGWTTNEDATVGLTGLQIADADAGSSPMRVTLSVPSGALTAASGAGVTVTGSGTGTLVLEGSQASINAYLASAARPNYVPVANFNGSVTLTMTTSDLGNTGTGGTLTDTDTATIGIADVNDAPAGTDRTVTINEDGTYTFSAADFPITDANDTPAHSLQSVVITTLPDAAQGVLRLNGVAVTAGQVIPVGSLGQLTFTPAANVNGAGIGAFTFQVVDSGGTANDGQNTDPTPNTFSFNVTAVNDAPVANPDTVAATEDTPLSIPVGNLLGNDTDVEGNTLTITSVQGAVNGTVSLVGGNVVFTPAPNFNGTASFTYTVSDGNGGTSTATVTVNVGAVNDAPVATDDVATTPINTPISSIPVLANDTDVDGDPLTVTGATVDPALGTVTVNADGTLNFTPANNVSGPVQITYTVSDGKGGTDTAILTVNIGANTPPQSADATVNGTEDTAVPLTLANFAFTDTDAGQSLAGVRIDTLPVNGTLLLNGVAVTAGQNVSAADIAAGRLTFVPGANGNGAAYASFTFSVQDSGGAFDAAPNTITFNIAAVNDAPVANPDTVAATEDTPLSTPVANLLGNDTDVEGNTLTITSVQGAVNGTVSLVGGNVVFTPAPNFNGAASFTYTVSDGNGGTSTATVTVNVGAVNDAPVATDDVATTPINTPISSIPVLANDTDVDGDPLTVTGATVDPALGTVTVNANGTLNFNPAANVSGPVQIEYTVSDGKGGTDTGVLTVNIGANTPPQSADATVGGTEDTPVVLVPANFAFTDADAGQSLAGVRIDSLPVNGTLLLNGVAVAVGQTVSASDIAAGNLRFVPGANGNGAAYASFTFSVQDSGGAFDAAPNTITFNIAAVNDAPVANPDTVAATEDTPVSIPVATLLGNDTDVEGNTLTITSVQGAVNGTVSLVGGNVVFTPAPNFNGAASFTYTVSDGNGGTSTATVTVNVGAVNDAPVAGDDLASTPINTPLANIPVLGNDIDVDGDVLTVTSATVDPALGTVTVNANGTLNFTPANNVTGPVQITYTVSDGKGGTDTAVLTVNVGTNTQPQGEDVTLNGTEDTPLPITRANFIFFDPDAGQTLANVRIDTVPLNGTLLLNGVAVVAGQVISVADIDAGNLSFVPAANGNGAAYASFTFSVQDSGGAFDGVPNTMTFNIAPVNDAPVAAPDTVVTAEDTPATGNVLANDTDIDGGPLTVTQFVVGGNTFTAGQTATIAGVGSLVINADGSYTFTPAANYNGPVPVATYTVSDGAATVTSTLTFSVTAVDDAFTDADETVSTNEDTPLTGSVLTGTTSVDGPVTVTNFTVAGDGTTYTAGQTANIAGVGTLVINANGSYTFTPAANYNGPVPVVTYSMTDGSSGDTSTLIITVAPVDDSFTDADEIASTNEDTPLTGSVLTGTTSVDGPVTVASFTVAGDATTYTAGQTATIANVGTLVINTDGSYTFTPAANYNGPVPLVTYTATDGSSTDTSTLTITVAPVDDAFTDANETVTTNEDTPLTGSVLTGTSSVDGPVTVTGFTVAGDGTAYTAGQTATIANVGTLVINANGSYTFTPAANYNGPVPVVTYSMTDGSSGDTSTLTITVAPVDDPFTDADEIASTNEDTPLTGSVLTGTSSVDGPVTVASFSVAGDATTYTAGQTATIANVGTLVINANGSYTFTPAANYNGPVPLVTYTATDGSSTDTSTLTITVSPVDDAFTDANETVGTNEDTPLTGSVLTGTTSVDGPVTVASFTVAGDATTYSAGQTATIANVGTLVINANGSYTFTPAANYNGPVPLVTYTATDGSSTDTSTLTITVAPVDDAFTDANETVTTNEDTPLTGSVLTGTTSVDGPVTVTGFTVAGDGTAYTAGQTANIAGVGTLVINANGSYTFTPVANYNGPVPVVTYSMTDGSSGDTSTLTITVAPVDDAFTDADETASTNEDTPLTGSVLTGTTSVDGPVTVTSFTVAGDATTYTAGQTATIANVGTLVINANGSYTFTPAANYNGPVPVATYSLTDGSSTDTSTLTITVTPVDDAFIDADEIVSTNEDTPLTGSVLTGTTSVDGPVTVTSFTVAGDATTYTAGQTATIANVGTLVINANGSYTFTPAANYNGPVPVATYSMTDGSSTDTSTLTIIVAPVDDAFTDADEIASTNEDTPLTGSVLTGTTSVDGSVTVTSFTVAGDATTYTAGQTATIANVGTLVINANGSYTFTPAANYNGPVPVATYSMTDGSSTDTSTLTITVTPVDDPFTDANETVSTNEDTPLTGSVLTGTTSVDGPVTVTGFTVAGDATTYTAGQTATIVGVGTLAINADGTYTFTPAANYNGPVPVVTYSMTDGSSTDTSALTITVTPVDDAFTDADETVSTNEDVPLTGSVLTGTTSVDGPVTVTGFTVAGDATTYTAGQTATIANVGTLVINANGSYTFTPAANYNGPVPVVTYSLTDGSSTDTSTLTIAVAPVDDPFTDASETVTTDEDTPLAGSVLTGTSSVDGPVTVASFTVAGDGTTYTAGQTATIAGAGTLVINADGSYTFTPATNYNGAVPVVTYTTSDGSSTDTSTLTITVAAVNDAPDAVNDTATTPINTPLVNIPVLANDTDADGDPLTVTGASVGAGQGTVSVNPDGTIDFTPASGVTGPVQITYTVSDGKGGVDTATLTVTVGANTPPQGADATANGTEDTPLVLGPANFPFTDPDAGQALAGVRIDALPANGTLLLNGSAVVAGQVISATDIAAGRLTFVPGANGNGAAYASLGFSVQDTAGGFDTSPNTLTFAIAAVNDAPTASGAPANTSQNTPVAGQIVATDADGDPLGYALQQGPAHGTLVLNPDGSYVYTPAANFSGSDSFTILVSDGQGGLTPVTVPVNVAPTNAPPVVVAPPTGTVTPEDTPLAGSLQVADPDGDALTYTVTTAPAHGTLVINPDGSYVYTPAADFNGTDSFTVQVSDGRGGTISVTVPVGITPVNDAPVARPDAGAALGGAAVTIDVLGNDSDAEGDALSVRSINGVPVAAGGSVAVDGGRVTLNANGTLTFVPDFGFVGTPSFTYTVADSAGAESSGTVGLVVTAAPAPVPTGGADVEQLLAAGRPTDGKWDARDDALRTMYVPGHIIQAINGMRDLRGLASLDAKGPVRSAIEGIRTLDGTPPLDTPTPILDLAEHLQHRFQLLDPVQAIFSAQADARILDATRAGSEIVLGGEREPAANDRDVRPVPSSPAASGAPKSVGAEGSASPAMTAMAALDVDALMFSEQIALHIGQSFAEADLLAAALRTQIPSVPVTR